MRLREINTLAKVSKPLNVKMRVAKPYKAISLHVRHRACLLSHFGRVRLFATPWTVTCQAPLSMEFSRQEYWGGLPCPPPGGSSQPKDQACVSRLPRCQVGSLPLAPLGKPIRHCARQFVCIYSVHPCVSPVTIMRLRLREGKYLAHHHPARKLQDGHSHPGNRTPEALL